MYFRFYVYLRRIKYAKIMIVINRPAAAAVIIAAPIIEATVVVKTILPPLLIFSLYDNKILKSI